MQKSLTNINYRGYAKQLLRFDGLELSRNASPMDIDGVIEWDDKKIVLIEIKKKGVKVPYGERMTLQRMINDFWRAGKQAVAIVADHRVFNPAEDVIVADCIVREVYTSRERTWRPPKKMMTVENLVRLFLYNQS